MADGSWVHGDSFSRDRPRFADTLDMIKFLCKDVWTLVFRKQIDNLKTNHRVGPRFPFPSLSSPFSAFFPIFPSSPSRPSLPFFPFPHVRPPPPCQYFLEQVRGGFGGWSNGLTDGFLVNRGSTS